MALCLVPLIGVLTFALDGGLLVAQRRRAQSVADASAHAAATSLYTRYSTDAGLDPQGKAATVARTIALANGFNNDGSTNVVTVNIPPQSGTFNTKAGYAEVIVTYNQPRIFSAIWGSGVLPVNGRAVARGKLGPKSPASVILLDPSSSGSLSVSGSGHIISTGAIQINSSSSSAAIASNSGYAQAPTISMTGNYTTSTSGYFSGSMSPNSSVVADPLLSLAAPTTSGLSAQPNPPSYGSYAMSPGIYNGGVSLGGGMTVTMAPGLYYMKGGFSVANGATLSGTGVTIYLDSSGGALSFQGGGVISLTAPTTGTYAGITVFQDRANTSSISIANGSTSAITGTIYAPSSAVSFAGGAANSEYGSQFIVKRMNISNNAAIKVNSTTGNVAQGKSLNLVE
jgi:hypothetical protein